MRQGVNAAGWSQALMVPQQIPSHVSIIRLGYIILDAAALCILQVSE